MRIIAGTARGRPILGPRSGGAIRPTADRVRETVFNVLGQSLEGCEVLDLFAGTGALALESLSRGAARAVMVDVRRDALRLCRANAEALGFSDRVEILGMSVERAGKRLGRDQQRFDLAFADPPYAAKAVPAVLGWLGELELVKPGGVACVEHDKREEVPHAVGRLAKFDQRKFGDTLVTFYRTS